MKYESSENTLPTVDSSISYSEDYHSSVISAITLEDDFAPCRPQRRLDRYEEFKLQSLAEQKRASDPNIEELEQCLDALRLPSGEVNRFSNSSNSKPLSMPTRKSSSRGLDYQMALLADNDCSFFLEEDSPFRTIDCDDESKEYIEPLGSFDSFTITLNDEEEFKAPVEVENKRKPRRSYRGRRKPADVALSGYSRTSTSAQSLELGDVFGDRL